MNKILRLGVVGVGSIGKEHVRILSKLKDCVLVGIVDTDQQLAAVVAERFSTRRFKKPDDLFAQNIDAISICTPTSSHFRIARTAIEKNIHSLIEKPITKTISQAKKLIDLAEKKKLKLMVGYVERFNPIVAVIKRRIKGETVISINFTRVGPVPPKVGDIGITLDLATHDIDLLRYLLETDFKKIKSVSSTQNNREDAAVLSFKLGNGTIASIVTNWYTPYKVRKIEIATKNKFIVGDFILQEVHEHYNYKVGGTYSTKVIPVKKTEPLKEELKAFVESIKLDKITKVTGEDGLEALKIAVRCTKLAS